MRSTYVVTYDICEPKRLRQVFRLMRGYGDHLQLSVFRCELSARERVELISKISKTIKHDEDQVLFFSLGPAGGVRTEEIYYVGRVYQHEQHAAVVI